MRSEKLVFAHKEVLFQKFKDIHLPVSEYSFSNLYLFRNTHDYEVLFDRALFIKGKTYDGLPFLMPTDPITGLDYDYLKVMSKEHGAFFPIPEEWLSKFSNDEFDFTFEEGDSDYIYTREKLSEYPGRHLQNKRNLVKQFLRDYKSEAKPLTNDKLKDAVDILNQWQKDMEAPPEETDYHACLEALERYDDVVFCGFIYYVDGTPGGFIVGEEINPEMFVFHFAKGIRAFKGLYQYMYNDFAKALPEKYRYINFEQDLGKLALKIAKSSYIPDMMIKKYRVRLKSA